MPRMRVLEFVSRDEGADVLVVTNMWPEPERPVYGIFVKRQIDSLRVAGVKCDVLYLRGYLSPLVYPAAALALAMSTLRWRRRYRLVHVHAGETSLVARFFVGPPMLVSYCGDDVLGDPREDGSIGSMQRLRAWLIRACSLLFSATITKTREMHARLPRRSRHRNNVIPNGVDTQLFRPIDRNSARAQLGWPTDEHVALFAATKPDSARKRRGLAEDSVREAERLLEAPVRLHVAGKVPPDEIPILMSAADCLVHTSSLEGSPNVVKEALMCGLPVVATPSGDVEELLAGVDPSYVRPPDTAALGAAVADCIRRGLRSNGREAARHLAAEEVARRVVDIYERLGRARTRAEATAEQ